MDTSNKTLELEITLRCNFRCEYCTNGRNDVLPYAIHECPLDKIWSIAKNFDSIYIYGGEPLLYGRITDLVKLLAGAHKNYVIQTNLSLARVAESIISTDPNVAFQVSLHRTQPAWQRTLRNVLAFRDNVSQCDVMFTSLDDLRFYQKYRRLVPNLRLIPVGDFASQSRKYLGCLRMYNKLRRIFNDVVFDDSVRSFVWEAQFDGLLSPKGKPCPCKDDYFQLDPSGALHHCPQRYDGDICPFDACFNIDKYEIAHRDTRSI